MSWHKIDLKLMKVTQELFIKKLKNIKTRCNYSSIEFFFNFVNIFVFVFTKDKYVKSYCLWLMPKNLLKYIAQCTVHSEQCTVYSVQCTVYISKKNSYLYLRRVIASAVPVFHQ